MKFATRKCLILILTVALMSCSVPAIAWERLDKDQVLLSNKEIADLLKAEAERNVFIERDKLLNEKIDILNQKLALKDMEIALERKRAEFAEEQTKKVMEISEFQAKGYQELLKVSKGSTLKDGLMYGIVGVAIGVILRGISW